FDHLCLCVSSRQAVKKPLNAFMLYMKEMRHQVQQEGREKESSAINRILGRKLRRFLCLETSTGFWKDCGSICGRSFMVGFLEQN
ncbi:hypothetical protein XENOCAPTIV_030841, partial [Xenoophorus captivus]